MMRIRDNEIEFRGDATETFHPHPMVYAGVVFGQDWRVVTHRHHYFELCFLDEGEGSFVVKDRSYMLQPGDLFLALPNENHYAAAKGGKPYRLYFFAFDLKRMGKLEADYYTASNVISAKSHQDELRRKFEELLDEMRTGNEYSVFMLRGMAMQLLVSVLRIYHSGKNGTAGKPLSPVMRNVLDMIYSDQPHAHDVDRLASGAGVSRSTLEREFKTLFGVSPGKYLRELSLSRAKRLLVETDDTITEIAEQEGFDSVHHFSIFFRKHTGMPPTEYRKRINGTK